MKSSLQKTLRTGILLLIAASASLGLTGCRDRDPLGPLVERVVEANQKTEKALYSSVDFTLVENYVEYVRQCDKVQCGTDYREVCDRDRVCSPPTTTCSPGRNVCTPGGQVCRRDPRTGRRYCSYVPGTCRWEPGYCSTIPGVCRDIIIGCRQVPVPRYCDTNCREVPVAKSRTREVTSPVKVTFQGVSNTDAIKAVMIGFKTNGRFDAAISDPALRPEGFENLFDSLAKEDKTVVILKAKGYELVDEQLFLKLPENFKAGDPIQLELQVRPTGSRKTTFSAVGTTEDIPAFRLEAGRTN
jgi:hypothetical protein